MMKKSQSLLEYSILLMIIIAAFLTMQVYIKRGFQGRWKQSVDDLGEQYDAQGFHGNTHYMTDTTSESRLYVVPGIVNGSNGSFTYRKDTSSSVEAKTSSTLMEPAGL